MSNVCIDASTVTDEIFCCEQHQGSGLGCTQLLYGQGYGHWAVDGMPCQYIAGQAFQSMVRLIKL